MASPAALPPVAALQTEGLQKEAEVVRTQIDQSVVAISIEMVKAIMAGFEPKLNFKQLAEKHITAYTVLPAEDEKAKRVFSKLSAAFHILSVTRADSTDASPTGVIELTLCMIAQTDSEANAVKFLETFIGNETRALIKRVDALGNPKLYEAALWQ